MTLLFHHEACLAHVPDPVCPERPQRLQAVLEALRAADPAGLEWREAPPASHAQLRRVHAAAYIERIFATAPKTGVRALDPDTSTSPGSLLAALHAAGAACAAVDAVMTGTDRHAFCAVRPPGHHAMPDTAMGFCLFNNIAVAAAHALAEHGLERIAIADFDVHHGNGTEAIFRHEPRVLFASSQQMPLYPGSGDPEHNDALRCNAALPPGTGSTAFRAAWEDILLPAIDAFAPELLLVSAGFDADRRDPLAQLELEPADYAWITQRLAALADRHAHGRLVSLLEGGYHLDALAEGVVAHVNAL